MQKYFRINLLFLLVASLLYGNMMAQSIVKRDVFTVNFSNALHEPLWVSYKLYRGGGECSRTKFRFHNDIDSLQTATDKIMLNPVTIKVIWPMPKTSPTTVARMS